MAPGMQNIDFESSWLMRACKSLQKT